jgi:hypothetical protein
MRRHRFLGWLVGATLVVALTACHPGLDASSNAQQPGTGASAGTAVGTAVAAPTSDPASSLAPAGAAQQSADLAAISSDLAGIDAGNSQANRDISAGDSASAQDDNN